mmetsp:Transcript_21282/g.48016  ORF Transcript_21282/g.48016 Transcript_21282/m.48016 type:complete len:434 (+) Transcript_21282:350-1651(+)
MSALLSAPSKVPKNTRLCELFLKPYDGKPPWQNGAFYLGCDVFVVSYASCHSLARRLTDKTLTISKAELDDETAEHSGAKLEAGILQWFLLSKGLDHWRDRLSDSYDTLVKYRTYLALPRDFKFTKCIGRLSHEGQGIIFAQSDTMFYATPQVFYGVFSSMFQDSWNIYVKNEATSQQQNIYRALLRDHHNFRMSCLNPDDFAPGPREIPLNERRQPAVFYKIEDIPGKRRKGNNARGNGKQGPRAGASKRKDRLLLAKTTLFEHPDSLEQRRLVQVSDQLKQQAKRASEQRFKAHFELLFCGCKFGLGAPHLGDRSNKGVGWKRPSYSTPRRFQNEPAMAFHIVTHNASCLPLDLPHREAFELYKERGDFKFGQIHKSGGTEKEVPEEHDDTEEESPREVAIGLLRRDTNGASYLAAIATIDGTFDDDKEGR